MLTTALLVLIPLILLAGVVAATLTAVDAAQLSVSRTALEKAVATHPAAVRARVLGQHSDRARTLAAVSMARMLTEAVMVAAVAALTVVVWDQLGLPGGWPLTLLATVLIAAVLVLVVLTVSPRTIGHRRPEAVLISNRTLVAAVRAVLWLPAGALTSVGASLAARPGHQEGPEDRAEKARQNVDRALEDEHVREGERDMIQGVFDLRGTMVRELMVPRTDMVAIPADATAQQAMRLFVRSGFSRIPVHGDGVDDLRGMLYVKDVMRAIHSPWDPRPERPVTEIMRPARFAPEFVAADEVLRQMQTSHVHITVLVDEYGGVAGIVTIEDILEEIVGEIADEHDRREPEIVDLGGGRYRVPARAGLSEVGDLFGLEIDDDDIDSIGGLLGKITGQVPIPGSRGTAYGLDLEAEQTAGRRKRLSTVLVGRAEDHDVHDRDQEDET
ncbi:hemolysin family protein [Brachybacterium sp. UNK5269]|uniref:hemolysin family protein n=1 Tax=Brachybacterium sp. UNK5269 TaxID=3408576 RepID=UPI003BB1B59A